jgi:hypothetical protein
MSERPGAVPGDLDSIFIHERRASIFGVRRSSLEFFTCLN